MYGNGTRLVATKSKRHWVRVVLIASVLAIAGTAAADPNVARTRRLLAVAQAIAREYSEAFDSQHNVVRPFELEEARLLLGELRRDAQDLGPRISNQVTKVDDLFTQRADVDQLKAAIDELRTTMRQETGIDESILPPQPPSPAFGRRVFEHHCASCHGIHGRGDGPDAATLRHKPADFTDPTFMRRESPLDFFVVVTVGRHQSAMPSWQETLSVQERWDVVSFLWSLHLPPTALEAGTRDFVDRCATCHAPAAVAADATQAVRPLDFEAISRRTDEELAAIIRGTETASHSHRYVDTLDDEQGWRLVAAVRSLTLRLASSSESADDDQRAAVAIARVAAMIQRSIDSYRLRDGEAPGLAAAAYLEFEPIESALSTSDPHLVADIERRFSRLQRVATQPDTMAEVEAAGRDVLRGLDDAVALLAGARGSLTWIVAGATLATGVALVALRSKRQR